MVNAVPPWTARCFSVAVAFLATTAFFGQWASPSPRRLEESFSAAAAEDAIIYGVGADNNVYQQELREMTADSSWTMAGRGAVTSITIRGDTVYAVGGDMRLYSQKLQEMEITTSQWEPASKASVVSVALHGDSIFAVAEDSRLYMQKLSTMTVSSHWEPLGTTGIMDIAAHESTLYAVSEDHKVYSQSLHNLTNPWKVAAAGYVVSITIQVGTIFGIGGNRELYRQTLTEMTPGSSWQLLNKGPIVSVAIWVPPSFEEVSELAKDRGSGNKTMVNRTKKIVAKQVNNMRFLTQGYNIFKGFPDSGAVSDDGFDVGFMEPIFELSYEGRKVSMDGSLKVPDGFYLEKYSACNGTFHSKYFGSMSAYLYSLIHRTGLEMLSGLKFLSGAFRLNPDFAIVASYFDDDAKVVTSSTRCATYQASRDSHKPVLTSAFQSAVKALPKVYGNGSQYKAFLERFGTHYPTFMEFGSIYGDVRVVSKQNQAFFDENQDMDIPSVAARVAAENLHMAAVPMTLESDDDAFTLHTRPQHLIAVGEKPRTNETNGTDGVLEAWMQATMDNPIPISYSLELITKLLPSSAQVNMHRAFTEYCKTRALPGTPEECQSTSECESPADCPEGLYCSLGQCMAVCRQNEDCDFHALCIAGHCTETCSNIWVTHHEEPESQGRSKSEHGHLLELQYNMDSSNKLGGAPTWWDLFGTHMIFYDESAGDWVLQAVKRASAAVKNDRLVRARFRNMPHQRNRHLQALWQVDMSNAREPDFRPTRVEVRCGECSLLTLRGVDMPWASEAFRQHVESHAWVSGVPVYLSERSQEMFIYYCSRDSSWYIQQYSQENWKSAKSGACGGVLHSTHGLLSRIWVEPPSAGVMELILGGPPSWHEPVEHTATPYCSSSINTA